MLKPPNCHLIVLSFCTYQPRSRKKTKRVLRRKSWVSISQRSLCSMWVKNIRVPSEGRHGRMSSESLVFLPKKREGNCKDFQYVFRWRRWVEGQLFGFRFMFQTHDSNLGSQVPSPICSPVQSSLMSRNPYTRTITWVCDSTAVLSSAHACV